MKEKGTQKFQQGDENFSTTRWQQNFEGQNEGKQGHYRVGLNSSSRKLPSCQVGQREKSAADRTD
jgi:hypothetical protein